MRAFFALFIPRSAIIDEVQGTLESDYGELKVVDPKLLHNACRCVSQMGKTIRNMVWYP
jgi:2'-5' RNA ligase